MKDLAEMYIPTFQDVTDAHARIAPHIHRTPVLTSSYFNELAGCELFFKCENFQKAGAFKVRGLPRCRPKPAAILCTLITTRA